ncbi:equilibrative nucleoside transporter 2-like [Eucyclogobius newberryi]|uniref:equilibrative nucleoside transporter 2-like n=1 Tax=Eucyclogobius newberryi TaxID=166745 RepID=UPI003B5BC053
MCNEEKLSPVDRGNAVLVIIFVLGVGSLLPWNFFIPASPYFNTRLSETSNSTSAFHKYNYDNWMSLLSQLPQVLFTLLNSCFYQCVRERLRVVISLVLILVLFVLTTALVQVPMHPDIFYIITLATICFINMSSAVLQGSLLGLVSLFPAPYTTSFMSGQGLAGVFASVTMLLSILSNADDKSMALGYFITPCVAVLVTLLCYLRLPHLVSAHITHVLIVSGVASPQSRPVMEIRLGDVFLQTFARFYLNQSSNNNLVMSKILFRDSDCNVKTLEAESVKTTDEAQRLPACAVLKKIWLMALCITFTFAITLSVFPVITVRVQTVCVQNKAWARVFTCVCCFTLFNVLDLIGRSTPYHWPGKDSCLFPALVVSRVALVPLLMMCNIDNSRQVLFRHDAFFVLLIALLSFSNGNLASLCMVYAPQLVHSKDAEMAGSLMSFFMALGLALGAAISFGLYSLL